MQEKAALLTDKEEKALLEIRYIRDQIGVFGANDAEFSKIQDILNRLESKQCSPERAIEEAHLVLNRKQDYH